jgi:hypothetical protein
VLQSPAAGFIVVACLQFRATSCVPGGPLSNRLARLTLVVLVASAGIAPVALAQHASARSAASPGQLGAAPGPAVAAASGGCKPVWFIGARGSGESASGSDGMGAEVDYMASVVAADLAGKGVDVVPMPVSYSADTVRYIVRLGIVLCRRRRLRGSRPGDQWPHRNVVGVRAEWHSKYRAPVPADALSGPTYSDTAGISSHRAPAHIAGRAYAVNRHANASTLR